MRKITQLQAGEFLASVNYTVASPPEAYATGSAALADLLAKLDQARNEFRANRLEEAEAALTRIVSIADWLLARANTVAGVDRPQVAMVGASALTLRGRAKENMHHLDLAIEDWKRAVELFDRYVPQTKPTAETWGYYGVILRIVGRRPEAIEALQKAFAGTGTPELYRHLGWALKDEGRYVEAETPLRKARELAPSDSTARRLLAETLLAQKRNKEAAAEYCEGAMLLARSAEMEAALDLADWAIVVDETCPSAYASRGEILRLWHRNSQDMEDAIKAFNRSLELNPDEVWVMASRGQAAAELGRIDAALADLDRAIKLAPDYVWARELETRILIAAGRMAEVIEVLRQTVELEGATESAFTCLAEALMFADAADKAWDVIDRGLSRFPRSPELMALRGESLRIQSRWDEALRCFEDALSANRNFPYALARKGVVLHALGRDAEAMEAFDEAIRLRSDYTWAIIQKASALEETQKTGEAIDLLNRAVAVDPKSAWAWASLAASLERTGQLEKALEAADEALKISPNQVDTLIVKGEVLRRLCRFDDALEELNKAIAQPPSNAYAIATKGQVLRTVARYQEAANAFEAAARVTDDLIWVLEEWADCADALERTTEAEQLRNRILGMYPKDDFERLAFAEVLAIRGEMDQALAILMALVKNRPRFAVAHEVLGRTLMEAGRYAEALAELDQALAIEPTAALALAYRGRTLATVKRATEAATALEGAVKLNPHLDWPVIDLANLYRDLHQPERAIASLDLVLQHTPAPLMALVLKAAAFCDIAEYDKALNCVNLAIPHRPSWSHLYAVKGRVLEYSGRIEEALKAYQEGFAHDGTDVWNRRGLADALRYVDQIDEADRHYSEIIKAVGPGVSDVWGLSMIGWCYYGLRQYKSAVSFYSEALSLDPNLLSSQFDLGLILAAFRRFEVALREYQRGLELAGQLPPACRRGFLHVGLVDLQTTMKASPKVAEAPEVQEAASLLQQALEQAWSERAGEQPLETVHSEIAVMEESAAFSCKTEFFGRHADNDDLAGRCLELTPPRSQKLVSVVSPSVAVNDQVVVYTGNWYAARSTDGGQTFQYIDPFTVFPNPPNLGFGRSQVMNYIAAIDTFVWVLKYVPKSGPQADNILRLAFAKTDDVAAGRWNLFDITAKSVGVAGQFMDFPDLAVGALSLYVTTNLFTSDGQSAGAAVVRIPVAGINSGHITAQSFVSRDLNSFRVAQNCGTTAFFAAHADTSTLRVFAWDENQAAPTSTSVGVAPWMWGQGYQSRTPDGRRWLDRVDPRITGATLAGKELWFAWAVDKGSNHRPQPFVQIARIGATNLTLVENINVFDQESATAYAGLSSNPNGDVGISYMIGGGSRFPSHMVGILTGQRRELLVATGDRGPSDGQWGKYLTIRPIFPAQKLFAATGYTLRSKGDGSERDATPDLVIFGRSRDVDPAFFPSQDKPDTERWAVKTGQDPDARLVGPPQGFIQTTIEELTNLPRPEDMVSLVQSYPQYQNRRAGPVELTIYSVEATVIAFKQIISGDYRLVLQGASGQTMIAAVPDPAESFIGSSRWAKEIALARNEIDKKLVSQQRTKVSPARVRIVGVGFFSLHGKTGGAANGIELHPVIGIHFLD
jgi:tetratricopeptide (TPR) repeat protein